MIKQFSIALLAFILVSCAKTNKQSSIENLPEIPVYKVIKTNSIIHNKLVARIKAQKNVEIRSRIKGYIEEILVDEGKEVKKGQALFKLSSPDYMADATKAEATLAKTIAEEHSTKLEVERIEMLVKKDVVAKSELTLAQSKLLIAQSAVAEAKAILKNAKAFLAYTTITAPFDGCINLIPYKIGSYINEGDLLTSISDISNVFAYFNVSETDYLKILKAKHKGENIPNSTVSLILADGKEYRHKGLVETVTSEIDGTTGTITFRARFNNSEKYLKHGASGVIVVDTEIENVLTIPQKAVLEIQDKNFVMVVNRNNSVSMRSVVLGYRQNNNYIVENGLQANELIVAEGGNSIKDGTLIRPIPLSTFEKLKK
jgi:membrane fusion protein (multidrug efflux system)